jgi:predicted O-methyltransferase YrrM
MDKLTATSDAARRALRAVSDGVFQDPDGNQDPHQGVGLAPVQLALLAYLARNCTTGLTIDIGFGMGSSATIIMAARAAQGGTFEHIAFDPYGLPDGRGRIVQRYLETTFPSNFKRIALQSELGLARLITERGRDCCGLILIDGDHRFDQVITDFFLADKLCPVGGYIVFDDALYPAIETAVNFVATNRPDYEVSHLPVWNTSIARRVRREQPSWDMFKPFAVPQRTGWTAAATDLPEKLP